MKRVLATATITALLISVIPNSYAATPKAGGTCSKAGATSTYAGKKYTCVKSGTKLVWNKGVAVAKPKPTVKAAGITCPVNGKCKIGNKGPGGGIVFYVSPTPQAWGQYLEVAPATWNGGSTDPRTPWCDVTDVSLVSYVTDPELKKLIGNEIGKGRGNTQLMTTYCKSGAANLATAYRGGGKSDWFLPSKHELAEMYVNRKTGIGGGCCGLDVDYWSSSENVVYDDEWHQLFSTAWLASFDNVYYMYSVKTNHHHVRPIRAFS